MRLVDFERLVLSEIYDEDIFEEYMERNILKIEEDFVGYKFSQNEKFQHFEVSTLEYLEEISKIGFYSEEELKRIITEKGIECKDEIIEKSLRIPVYCGMALLKDGMDYLDLMQEGSIGLIEATQNFLGSGYENFEDYVKVHIMRRMVIYTNERLMENKAEFLKYFENLKEDYEDRPEVADEIQKKISNIIETNYTDLCNTLNETEIKILERYYGLKNGERVSMYEIDELLKFEKGKSEEIFQNGINKLSKFGGEFFSV